MKDNRIRRAMALLLALAMCLCAPIAQAQEKMEATPGMASEALPTEKAEVQAEVRIEVETAGNSSVSYPVVLGLEDETVQGRIDAAIETGLSLANARLLLTKKNLKAFGALRGTNEKRRLLDIVPDMANPNTGIIRDGGVVIPYTISADVTDGKLLYGDPANYLLGLFGAYSIRVDESVKAVERMYAILGDVMVGGNLVVDKGFVVGTVGGGG